MKRIFIALVLTAGLIACNNKKSEEKTSGKDTTITTNTDTKTEENKEVTTNVNGVPNFSDPEVQKFANDYYTFLQEYKAALKDPSKAAEMTKTMGEWTNKTTEISMKLAANPEDAKKWADWAIVVSQEFSNAAKELYDPK